MAAVNVHPELLNQLERAGSKPLAAIVQLRSPANPQQVPTADEANELAHSVLERVTKDAGHPPLRTNILGNLASLIVQADSAFIRALIHQPEVVSAIPNETSESPFMPPVRKRPA